MSEMSKKQKLRIPKSLSDVNSSWISDLLKKVDPDCSDNFFGLSHLQISPFDEGENEGLFDRCQVLVEYNKPVKKTFHWIVQIIPQNDPDLKDIIARHKLLQKCLLVYGDVVTAIKNFIKEKSFDFILPLPSLVYGDYEDGCGFLVLDDWLHLGFKQSQPDLMRLLDPECIKLVIKNLSIFHGICTAFFLEETNDQKDIFALLDEDEGGVWFQDDMKPVLEDMYNTCLSFLKSIPGEEASSYWFESKMCQPSNLMQKNQTLKTLVHGDLWHNNIHFNGDKVIFSEWQMCHTGTPTNDFCFFLFSTTTTSYRKTDWDSCIRFYFDTYITTIRGLGVPEEVFSLLYEDFLNDLKASIPLSLFFSLNLKDIEPSAMPENESDIHSEMERVYSVDSSFFSEGSFGRIGQRLQTCFSLSQMNDITSTIFECDDDFSQENASESDSEGIVMNFDRKKKEKAKKSNTKKSPSAANIPESSFEDPRPLFKVPTVATDEEIRAVIESQQNRKSFDCNISPRKARALRRRLYLDLYKEVSSKKLI